MSARIWQAIDTAAHRFKVPQPWRKRICDRFESALTKGDADAPAVGVPALPADQRPAR